MSSGSGSIDYRTYPILLVADEKETLSTFTRNFGGQFSVQTTSSIEEANSLLQDKEHALVIAGPRIAGMTGLDWLESTIAAHPHVLRMVIADAADRTALLAGVARESIHQWITAPWQKDDLALTLRRALEMAALMRRNRLLVADLAAKRDELNHMVDERTQQLREFAQRQMRLAISDGLTGLKNHRHFQERWRREVRRAQRYGHHVALMMIDVDKFKNFNDTMGHPAGDTLLKNLAQMLTRSMRDVDLVARYGGEEFVVMLPETRKDDAVILAERVRSFVAQHPFDHRDVQPNGRITVSIGVAAFPGDGNGPNEVLQRADKALYRAKEGGRDRVVAATGGDSEGAATEDDGDLALIVEADGDTRVAAPSATDAPVAGAIDTMRLRLRQTQTAPDAQRLLGASTRAARLDEVESMGDMVVEVDDLADESGSHIAPWLLGHDESSDGD